MMRCRKHAVALVSSAVIIGGIGVQAAHACPGCEGRGSPAAVERTRTDAMHDGLRYLIDHQQPDGSWRSDRYHALSDGASLTPMALKVLLCAPSVEGVEGARRKAAGFLIGLAERLDDEAEPARLLYPVYTASMSAMALTRVGTPEALVARDRWVRLLREHQHSARLGWTSDELSYGGWGYSQEPPLRDIRAGCRLRSRGGADLSSTLFAVGALRMAGVAADDPVIVDARVFVERCQNAPGIDPAAICGIEPPPGTPVYNDGGFFFTPDEHGVAAQNKAGIAGVDSSGRTRFRSYGSTTADGLRALLRVGAEPSDWRVRHASSWLRQNAGVDVNPGHDPVRSADQRGSYFYYAWSLAHAMRAVDPGGSDAEWNDRRGALVGHVLSLQSEDGSWANGASAMMEDDPVVATCFALGVVGLCGG